MMPKWIKALSDEGWKLVEQKRSAQCPACRHLCVMFNTGQGRMLEVCTNVWCMHSKIAETEQK